MAVTFKNYVSVLLRQSWRDTKSFFGWNLQTITTSVLVVLSWVVLGQWKGQAAVQGELVPMLAFLAPLLIAALLIFGVNTLVITPYRLINREISKKKAAIAQCNALRENQKPALEVEVSDGDNRYLITADHSQGNKRLGTAYTGRFSVSTPPDHTESVHGVTVVLKDILGTGTDFRDVRLRFDGESQAYPVPINVLIGVEGVAALIGLSVSWVEKHPDELPPRRSVAGNPRWVKSEVLAWIAQRPVYGQGA